jgi:hypothetical protein
MLRAPRAIIRCSSPFPNFLKVRDDLLLEEIHLDTTGPSAAPTALYTSTMPLAPKPQPYMLSRSPNSNNNQNKNNNHRNGDNGGGNDDKNNSSGGGHSGNSGNTTVASTGSTSNDDSATSPWLTYINPWQGHIVMYPSSVTMGQQRSQAFLATPGHYKPPRFMARQ